MLGSIPLAWIAPTIGSSRAVTVTHHQQGTRIRSLDSAVTLDFTPTEWAAFVVGAQDGEFGYHTQVAALIV